MRDTIRPKLVALTKVCRAEVRWPRDDCSLHTDPKVFLTF